MSGRGDISDTCRGESRDEVSALESSGLFGLFAPVEVGDDGRPTGVAPEGPGRDEGVHVGTMYRFKRRDRCVIIVGVSEGLIPRSSVDAWRQTDRLRHRRELRRARSLLFVAATRARDALTLSWNGEPSRFFRPLRARYTQR